MADVHATNIPAFLAEGGQTGRLIAARDWSATPLGPIEGWPQSLKSMLGFLLRSPVPIVMLWGEDGVMLYNDAYSVFAGGRHPDLLGSKVREGWPEVADFNDNVMRVGLAGGTLAYRDQELTLYRHGHPEQVWMNLDYSPVLDEEGKPAGVLAIVIETTERVAAERRRQAAEAQLRESEARFRALVNASSDIVYRMSADWTEMRQLDGRGFVTDLDEPSTRWLETYIFPEDQPSILAAVAEAARTGSTFELEHRVRRVDGSVGWTFSRAVPVFGERGEVVEWFGMAADVTRRKQAEGLRAVQQRVLELVIEDKPLESALSELIEAVEAQAERRVIGSILLLDADGRHLRHGAAPNLPPSYTAAIDGVEIGPSVGSCGTAAYTGSPVVATDIASDPRWADFRDLALGHKLQACWSTPILASDGKVLGTFAMYYREPREPTPEHMDLVGFVTRSAALVIERKRALGALRESEERFRNIADHSPVMIWVTDPTGYCAYLNRRWHDFTGQQPSEAEGFGWLDAVHPEDREYAQREFMTANATARPFRAEFRIRRRDGAFRWVIDAASPRFDANGEFLGYVGSVIDIDERRESEDRLLVSEGRFRAAVDAMEGVLWTNDASGRMTGKQPGWSRLTGQTEAEYQGYGWADVVHPEDIQATIDAWNEALTEKKTFVFEHRVRRRDGAWRRYAIRAIPVFGAGDEVIEWVGVHTDITEQREAEERLRLSEAAAREERDRTQGYLQVAQVMLLVLDEHGVVETINRKGAEILGYADPSELIGRDWFETAVAPANRATLRGVFARLMAGEIDEIREYENHVLRADGSERLIAWRNSVLRDENGRIVGSLSSGEDVTEQREAEARERLLAQEVDHRAKNLLAVVQSVVQLTRGEDIRDFKDAVTGRIQSLARTHGLLAAARWEGADLKQIVSDELAPYSRGDEGRVRVDGPALHLTPAAAQALALVIHELATNAAKYGALSRPSGSVSVNWSNMTKGVVLEWIESGGPETSPPSRRGFGSIVLQTSVERQLRGAVSLDWRPEGLACRLEVPAAEVLASVRKPQGSGGAARDDRRSPPPRAEGRRILVLEDEALIAAQLEQVLASAGYEVIGPAARVPEAFDRFYSDRPDAALLDINLAGDRSFPLAELLRDKGVPFALCTGYGEAAIVPPELRDAPLIVKPFDPDELVRAVGALLA